MNEVRDAPENKERGRRERHRGREELDRVREKGAITEGRME